MFIYGHTAQSKMPISQRAALTNLSEAGLRRRVGIFVAPLAVACVRTRVTEGTKLMLFENLKHVY